MSRAENAVSDAQRAIVEDIEFDGCVVRQSWNSVVPIRYIAEIFGGQTPVWIHKHGAHLCVECERTTSCAGICLSKDRACKSS